MNNKTLMLLPFIAMSSLANDKLDLELDTSVEVHYQSVKPRLLPFDSPPESECKESKDTGKIVANKDADLFICKGNRWYKFQLTPVLEK